MLRREVWIIAGVLVVVVLMFGYNVAVWRACNGTVVRGMWSFVCIDAR